MFAMVLEKLQSPLNLIQIADPIPKDKELLIKVYACGLCRTDLHIIDGDLSPPHFPRILGHEIVGVVAKVGNNVQKYRKGDLVGIPWLFSTCGKCEFCLKDKENLCLNAQFTGYHVDGGFSEYTICKEEFAIPLHLDLPFTYIAPHLCAGLIGYRSYLMANPEKSLGIYGFGVAAHILTLIAKFEEKSIYAFTKEDDEEKLQFAQDLGAIWSGSSLTLPPTLLDAAIIFAPVGSLVPLALRALKKGGRCVCGGIHMSDIPAFPYKDLWGEKSIRSVANLTRKDAKKYFSYLSKRLIRPHIKEYPLDKLNDAIDDMRQGKIKGSAVIKICE